MVACDEDGVARPRPSYRAAAKAPRGELVIVSGGQHAPYEEAKLDEAVGAQILFLRRHLVDEVEKASPDRRRRGQHSGHSDEWSRRG